jgi:membrane-associated protease RseP (regulator of RpoE activity)
MTAGMGWQQNNMQAVLIWIGCVLVSILVHEYGHALMAKRFGGSPSIVLWGLGGLCYSEGERTPARRLAVLLAGPGAGFVLLLIVLAVTSLFFGITGNEHIAVIQSQVGLSENHQDAVAGLGKLRSFAGIIIYSNLVWINLWWGLVNLLPIYPLDGGQAAQVVWTQVDRRHGVRRSHILSLVTAGILAVLALSLNRDDFYLPIFFGILGLLNFQVLQSLHQAQSLGIDHDDDWWRG